MADQPRNTNSSSSDEIDLGQLFTMIGNGFRSVFRAFLRLFLYFKRNALILIGLVVIGLAIGFGLKQITSKKLKTEVIVRPNMESKDYLYDVVDEIQANIEAEDETFFKPMGIEVENLKGFKVSIEAMGDKDDKLEDELKYLETLKGLNMSADLSDIVRSEILERHSFNHKITFLYTDAQTGQEYAHKMLDYINTNGYYKDLVAVQLENSKERIAQNERILAQLDALIHTYTDKLARTNSASSEGKILLESDQAMDVKGLFQTKSTLLEDIEEQKMDLKTMDQPIKVINFGNPQEIIHSFFGKKLVLIPLLLLGAFFLWSVLKYLNQKSKELL